MHPLPPPPSSSFHRPSPQAINWRWVLAGLVPVAVLLFVRSPYVVLRPQFWHEDAIVFLVQQRTDGYAAIIRPYAGYLHLFPRLVAAGATLFPLEYTPQVYLIAAYIGWLWVASLILTSPLFASRQWNLIAALAWIAVPHGGEVFLNPTNAQWAFAVGLALLLAEPTPDKRNSVFRFGFVIVSILSGPFCIFLSPVAAWRLYLVKRQQGTIDSTAVLVLSSAILQLFAVMHSSDRLHEATTFDASRLSLMLWIAVFPELFGTQGALLADFGLRISGTIAGIAGVLWATWAAIPGSTVRRQLLLSGGLILGSGMLYLVATKGGAPLAYGGGQRYLFVPFALYVMALISAWSYCPKPNRTWWYGFLLLVIIAYHTSQQFVANRYPVPDWKTASKYLQSGQSVEIKVYPFGVNVAIPPDKIPISPPKP